MFQDIQERIAQACQRAGRKPQDVKLVAVTKGHDVAAIEQYVLSHGHRILGENRVQEWRDKAEELEAIEWHMIGNLQRNKVKYCLGFHLIHSLNSSRLADALNAYGAKHHHVFQTLIEVNIANEVSKQGVPPHQVETLVQYVTSLPYVNVQGLMAMAPYADDAEASREYFVKIRTLRDTLALRELSMGMSNDFEVAIEEGATIVRVGSAIFQ